VNALFQAARIAGLALYGPPRDYEKDDFGGSGLIWFDDQHVIHVQGDQIPQPPYDDENDYQDGPEGSYPFVDDFEFQFHPSTSAGVDVAGDEVLSLIPDIDGNVYLYYPEQGIRVIHMR
jgi:hypothetical protein